MDENKYHDALKTTISAVFTIIFSSFASISPKMLPLILFLSVLSHVLFTESIESFSKANKLLKSEVYHSPPMHMQSGVAIDKRFYNIPFPKGHIAIKSFDAEVVDEHGNSVPLFDTYLHHWILVRYHVKKGEVPNRTNINVMKNLGMCNHMLPEYYGLGSEARKTSTWVPDPYGIQVGNPNDIPDGYEEQWYLNILGLDTRDVEDRVGCTECRCNLFNTTKDPFGHPLPAGYIGGLGCCYDQQKCLMKKGAQRTNKTEFLKYTVQWTDWVDSIIPVKIYILDVAGTKLSGSGHETCLLEYDVLACKNKTEPANCIHNKRTNFALPVGGDLVFGVSHQHAGTLGLSLYGQDGSTLCASKPIYGQGNEVGNEKGYVVGMTTCYPKPGSVKIAAGEVLTVESSYKSDTDITGVMALLTIMIAEPQSVDVFHSTSIM